MVQTNLQVNVDICVLLYAEAWPCGWPETLQFWDSRILTSPDLQANIHTTTFFNPPVRAFLKAGFGGVAMLKKTCLMHITNRVTGLPLHPPGIEANRIFMEWRPSLVAPFLQQPRLYVECPRSEAKTYIRVLNIIAVAFNLKINGGGRQISYRSFADCR